ncbi:hypothetical protein ACIBG8_07085 [Nonomuraea sp. NPDC050556]
MEQDGAAAQPDSFETPVDVAEVEHILDELHMQRVPGVIDETN